MIAIADRASLNVSSVGSGTRFGQSERRQFFAFGLWHEPALLLLFGGPLVEREAVETDVDAHDDAQERVNGLELFTRQREADVVESATTVALRDRQTEDAYLAHPIQDFGMVLAARVPLLNVWGDLPIGETPDHVANLHLLVGVLEIHARLLLSFTCGVRRNHARSPIPRIQASIANRHSPADSAPLQEEAHATSQRAWNSRRVTSNELREEILRGIR